MSTPSNKFLELISKFDNAPLDFGTNFTPYYRFFLSPEDPRPHGFIHPTTVSKLPWPSTFLIDHAVPSITISPSSSPTHINTALQDAVDAAIASSQFPTLNGSHSEPFLIPGARGSIPTTVERFAATLFGTTTRGAHMTAFVRDPETTTTTSTTSSSSSSLKIWVARRSHHLATYPGQLDSTVAGGIKASHSPTVCILAEAEEEASLPSSLIHSSRCRPVGALTMANVNPRTTLYHSELIYVYDLELPPDVLPVPGDDEVDSFLLMTPEEVIRAMEAGEFKPNVCPVMIDFLLRHGIITPEGEGEWAYAEICMRLHRRLPVPLVSDQ